MVNTENFKSKITVLISVFLISLSLFIYQVVLTRLYSVIFSYHYVFLITSLAIFGLGIGSILAYKKKRPSKGDIKKKVNTGSIILTLGYISVFVLNYLLTFVNSVVINIFIAVIPFIIAGFIYSILFTEFTQISGKLYFADLIGAGVGSIGVIFMLNNAGMLKTVIVLSIIAIIPSIILPKRKITGLVIPVLLIACLFLPAKFIGSIETNFKGVLNNTEKTYGSTKNAGMNPKILFSKWNAFSRTDVIEFQDQPEEMIITIDGTANSPMYQFDGKVENLDKFKKDNGYLPFSLGDNKKTLLIGSGGGRDVLYALAGGSTDISAVEINTSTIEAVREFGKYNGNIYNRPEVQVYAEDGRSFVRKSEENYDLIFLSLVMTNSSQGVAYAMSENYIYTVQAMEDYLDRLNENGKIAFLAHSQKDTTKLLTTAIKAMQKRGISIKDATDHIAVFSGVMEHGAGVHMDEPVIIIKNKPFTENESKKLMETAEQNGIMTVYAPVVLEEGLLHHLKMEHITLDGYIATTPINISPATDDSPYFYNYTKSIPKTLYIILLTVILGSVLLFSYFAKKRHVKSISYFSLLGIGFMMIEVPMIQKFTLYLGHPTLAFTYVLAALLIGCGIGGYFSNTYFDKKGKNFYLPPFMVALINIVLLIALGFVFKQTANLNVTVKIIISVVLMMVQGFFMGMPFPRGLKILGKTKRHKYVPIMWGVNGVASVAGSVLSIIISMVVGFTGAMIVGAGIYLIVGLYKNL